LKDVDVEMKDGKREGPGPEFSGSEYSGDDKADPFDGKGTKAFPILRPSEYPLVGSSIATSRIHKEIKVGCGTLGGYVLVDDNVYALSNHHVIFGNKRRELFPSTDQGLVKILVDQPARRDLDYILAIRKNQLEGLEETLKTHSKDSSVYQEDELQCQLLQKQVSHLEQWTGEKLLLGTVFRSSGFGVCGELGYRRRRDWVLLKVENPQRCDFKDNKLVNQVSFI
jgi:hypothetical protein